MTRIICADCGRACHAERTEERGTGFCGCGLLPRAALARAHFGEEPCISGKRGSGTVFFCGCSLGCVFCQNYEISQLGNGKEITVERLAEIFLEQQQRNVENINLVTPTSYVPQIIEALKIAKERGEVIETAVLSKVVNITFGTLFKQLSEMPLNIVDQIVDYVRVDEDPREKVIKLLVDSITANLQSGLKLAENTAKKYYELDDNKTSTN